MPPAPAARLLLGARCLPRMRGHPVVWGYRVCRRVAALPRPRPLRACHRSSSSGRWRAGSRMAVVPFPSHPIGPRGRAARFGRGLSLSHLSESPGLAARRLERNGPSSSSRGGPEPSEHLQAPATVRATVRVTVRVTVPVTLAQLSGLLGRIGRHRVIQVRGAIGVCSNSDSDSDSDSDSVGDSDDLCARTCRARRTLRCHRRPCLQVEAPAIFIVIFLFLLITD
jgi:hypothetical protein